MKRKKLVKKLVFKIPTEDRVRLESYCDKYNLSLSEVVREAIKRQRVLQVPIDLSYYEKVGIEPMCVLVTQDAYTYIKSVAKIRGMTMAYILTSLDLVYKERG